MKAFILISLLTLTASHAFAADSALTDDQTAQVKALVQNCLEMDTHKISCTSLGDNQKTITYGWKVKEECVDQIGVKRAAAFSGDEAGKIQNGALILDGQVISFTAYAQQGSDGDNYQLAIAGAQYQGTNDCVVDALDVLKELFGN